MSQVPKFYYFKGRGKGETIRLLFAVNDAKFDEFDFTERSQFEDLLSSGSLLFRQVPLLEMDGLKMVQSAAICRYLARKFQMNGADTVEEFRIDMLFEGTRDFLNFFMGFGFLGSDEEIVKKAKEQGLPRYMPIFEKILVENGTENLVGNRLTLADIGYFEVLLHIEERLPEELDKFPATQEFFKKIKQIPSMDQYLTNVRPPKPDDEYVKIVKSVLLF